MAYRIVGNIVAEWNETIPLTFTLKTTTGPLGGQEQKILSCDLTALSEGFTEDFLLHLKEYFLERCNQVGLSAIGAAFSAITALFRKVIDLNLYATRVPIIDESFVLCIAANRERFTKHQLRYFRTAFRNNPDSPLFSSGLADSDFPVYQSKKGRHGEQIDSILAKALSRAAVAHILDVADTAYATGQMDIGHYSFVHLSFAVFCRPNSYRQIRVGDFSASTSGHYSIRIVTAKTGEEFPSKVNYCINEHLGVLLAKQRQHVVAQYGHLVHPNDVEKLALFPARRLNNGNSRWAHDYANQNFGMYRDSNRFTVGYTKNIKRTHFAREKFTLGANALRHTIGTHLAHSGVHKTTIQAVLKHAQPQTCQAYVDIAFRGLMEELSEALRPAFAEHLPALINFRSRNDPVATEKAVKSWDQETNLFEDTGECGKSIACANAPIVCYGCFRFIPCWDADHGINLRIVEKDIERMRKRGKPFEHMLARARTAKSQIVLVMNLADRHREALRQGSQT